MDWLIEWLDISLFQTFRNILPAALSALYVQFIVSLLLFPSFIYSFLFSLGKRRRRRRRRRRSIQA